MHLESYPYDLCPWQHEETINHFFLHCNFAKHCMLGIHWHFFAESLQLEKSYISMVKRRITVSFFREIIILMTWPIWTTRNDWIFNNKDPTIEGCMEKFIKEFKLLTLRVKKVSPHN
jgi:hypothetical protein